MGTKLRKNGIELSKTVEMVCPFFIWGLLTPTDEGAQRYGFDDLRAALTFWKTNQEAFKRHLGPEYFKSCNDSVESLTRGSV